MNNHPHKFDWIPIGITLSIIAIIFIAFALTRLIGIHRLTEIKIFISIFILLGLIILIVWVPILIAGVYTLGHRGAVGMSGHLINYGIYKYVRNPMYSGLAFTLLGLGLVLNNIGLIVACGIWWIISFIECNREIKGLEKRFGPAYKQYESQTPEFFPNFKLMLADFKAKR
ncbi:MAG: hypothetical protein HQ596_00855 [Candidatus Saganbacteria bacterium]|nr:hypothetical protein [Candidatus Saganbacteria bacterium]